MPWNRISEISEQQEQGGKRGVTLQGKEALPQQDAASARHTACLPPSSIGFVILRGYQEPGGNMAPVVPTPISGPSVLQWGPA